MYLFVHFFRYIFFMHNQEIDHLYSLSENSYQGQFGINTIRMKSNLGISGKAFTNCSIYYETEITSSTSLI